MSQPQAAYDERRSSPALLSTETVAERLDCSPRTVMRLTDRGELIRVRIGKLVRYRAEDLEALIEQHLQDDSRPAGKPGAVTTSAGRGRHVERTTTSP